VAYYKFMERRWKRRYRPTNNPSVLG